MKCYEFYFISPSVRDNFPRKIIRKCKDDCEAIAWALGEYATGDVEDIAVYDSGDCKTIRIYLAK